MAVLCRILIQWQSPNDDRVLSVLCKLWMSSLQGNKPTIAEQMKKIHEETKAALTMAQETMKRNYDQKKGEAWEYQIGDKVWLEGTNVTMEQPIKKLDDKCHGPFIIIGKEGKSAYRLWLPKTWKRIHPVFNKQFLSPFTPAQYPSQQPPKPAPPVIVEEEYEINKLMDSKFSQGKLHYLIKWKDYPNCADWTWEPEGKILPENKDEFHEKHPSAPWRITAQLKFKPMPKPTMHFKIQEQTWPEGKESLSFSQEYLLNEDVFLPLLPQFFEKIEIREKTHEYQNYLLPEAKCFWFINTETKMITHMAKVGGGKQHEDKQPDGMPK